MSTVSLARGKVAGAWREHILQSSVEVKEKVVLYLLLGAFTAFYGGKKLPLRYVHDRITPPPLQKKDTLSHFRVVEKSTCPLWDLEAGQSDCRACKPC